MMPIAITRDDGGVSIVNFPRGADQAAIDAEIARLAPKAWREVGPGDLPANRVDRDAWADDGKTVIIHPDRLAALKEARAAIRDPLAEIDALRAMIARADSLPDLQEAIQADEAARTKLKGKR